MKDLIKSTLLNGDFGAMQTAALVIFSCVMAGAALWVFRPGSRSTYQTIAIDALKGDQDDRTNQSK